MRRCAGVAGGRRPLPRAVRGRASARGPGGLPGGARREGTPATFVRRSLAAIGLAGLALAGGCSLSMSGSGAATREPELRIWVPPVVYWEAGGDRRVDIALENGSTRTVVLAEPDPAYARVAVFPGGDNLRICGVEPRSPPPGARSRMEIPPGGSAAVRIDLGKACADVAPGEYRFEVDYRSPPVEGAKTFSGTFATRYGELIVEGAPAGAQAERPASPRAGRSPPRSSTRRGE